jgi:hypothetical protein
VLIFGLSLSAKTKECHLRVTDSSLGVDKTLDLTDPDSEKKLFVRHGKE